jgi:signal transduction histidine kinase
MISSLNAFSGIFVVAHALLLIWALVRLRRREERTRLAWLIATLFLSGLTIGILSLPGESLAGTHLTENVFVQGGIIATTIAYCGVVLLDVRRSYLSRRFQVGYALVGSIWLISFAAIAIIDATPVQGWAQWADFGTGVAGLVAVGGLLLWSGGTLLNTMYHFYYAHMPEVANRAAFRTMISAIYLVSAVMLISATDVFILPGMLLLFMALIATSYASYQHRLLDVRFAILRSAQVLLVVITGWGLMFVALYAFKSANISLDLAGTLIVLALALLISVILIPTRQAIELVFHQIETRSQPSLALATAEYSQKVALTASLEDVVTVTAQTMNKVMRVRRSALILINNTFRVTESVELIMMEAGATFDRPSLSGYLHKQSPIYRTLAVEKVPLTQFDIEYGAPYRHTAATERAFFKQMRLEAYLPIISENAVIGILACGAKLNDMPYSREDMETLMVIGQQVGTALRQARLIDDLQHLNNSMRALNTRLENAKDELEKLDSVKTDFITIASHELRTPLAQIRGYTDILDSMNEQGLLQPGQTTQMVQSLRRSAERMEELISNMLDVSQIDVKALDLRFVRAAPETLVRLALDPLNEALEQRRITIERVGLSGLPHIQADMQRMVQAFRNIILNAVKFTPDGGTIEISAHYEPAKEEGEIEYVKFAFKDTGVGIAQKDIELIFQKFYRGFDTQLHSTGLYKFMGAGPGLGLTIARGIITGHGGKIWAQSPGHDMQTFPGTTFFVRLPVNPPAGTRRVLPFDSGEFNTVQRATAPTPLETPRVTAKDTSEMQRVSTNNTGATTPVKAASDGATSKSPPAS